MLWQWSCDCQVYWRAMSENILDRKPDELISFTFESLEHTAQDRPKGYKEMVLKYSKVWGGRIWMTPQDHQRIRNYYLYQRPMEPSLGDMTKNLFRSLSTWAMQGFPIANEKQIEKRRNACLNCVYWDRKARNGFGKCNHSKCGCTQVKWWLASEKCPDGKW